MVATGNRSKRALQTTLYLRHKNNVLLSYSILFKEVTIGLFEKQPTYLRFLFSCGWGLLVLHLLPSPSLPPSLPPSHVLSFSSTAALSVSPPAVPSLQCCQGTRLPVCLYPPALWSGHLGQERSCQTSRLPPSSLPPAHVLSSSSTAALSVSPQAVPSLQCCQGTRFPVCLYPPALWSGRREAAVRPPASLPPHSLPPMFSLPLLSLSLLKLCLLSNVVKETRLPVCLYPPSL